MSDDLIEEVLAYTINRFDCPYCGDVNETDAEFARIETCSGCQEDVAVS